MVPAPIARMVDGMPNMVRHRQMQAIRPGITGQRVASEIWGAREKAQGAVAIRKAATRLVLQRKRPTLHAKVVSRNVSPRPTSRDAWRGSRVVCLASWQLRLLTREAGRDPV